MHLVPLRKDQLEAYKIINGSQGLFYMIRQGKPSLTKVDRENLRVCLLEVGGLVGKVIFLEGYPK